MLDKFTIHTQVIPACVGGTCFIILALYFAILPKNSRTNRYFIFYLLGMSFFISMKPFQLIADSATMQLTICNLRYLCLMMLSGPMVIRIIESLQSNIQPLSSKLLVLLSSGFATTYVFFNTTSFSKQTALLTAALFGIIFFIIPAVRGLHLAKSAHNQSLLYFSLGIIVFGTCLSICSIINIFWPLYFLALPNAWICTYAVLLEMKNFSAKYDQMLPLVRDELLDSITSTETSPQQLHKLLNLLACPVEPTRIAIIKQNIPKSNSLEKLEQKLKEQFPTDSAFSLRLGESKLLLLLNNMNIRTVVELLEQCLGMNNENDKSNYSAGVGSHQNIDQLSLSFKDALIALTYASRFDDGFVVSHDEIDGQSTEKSKYPRSTRNDILLSLRNGILVNLRENLAKFQSQLSDFCQNDLEQYLFHCSQLLHSATEASVECGINSSQTSKLSYQTFKQLKKCSDINEVDQIILDYLNKLSSLISNLPVERSSAMLQKSREFIDNNLTQNITIDKMAEINNISPSHFRRLFKKETGKTFNQFLLDRKVEIAKEKLLQPDKSISEIAYELGFNDSNYFSTVFKKITSKSPSEFRKKSE